MSKGHLDSLRTFLESRCIAAIASRLLKHTGCIFFGGTDMPNIGIPTNNHFWVPGILWYHES